MAVSDWFGSTALLGIVSSFIMLFLVEWIFDILVISMRWDIVWANRVSVMLGPNLTEAMTQDYLVSGGGYGQYSWYGR